MGKSRRYFKSEVKQIQGPNEMLNFLEDKTEISREEVTQIFDEFFSSEAKNAKEMKAQAWAYVEAGREVSLNGISITTKK